MTVSESRDDLTAPPIPRPRSGSASAIEPEPIATHDVEVEAAPEPPAARYPWPEPWRPARGARPRTEYWDVATAGWRARGPLPRPRPGD